MKKDVVVIVPAYNEEATIGELIKRVSPFADICIVDDASKDRTAGITKLFPSVKLISHEKNMHIPQTILDGMKYALGKGYKQIITMDAGLSHKPEELPNFLNIEDFDLVLSVRKKSKNVPLFRKTLSKMATFLINFVIRPIGSELPHKKFHDVTSGYRMYSRRAVKLLLDRKMRARTFDFHTEALMLIFRNGLKITEVPITYNFSNSSLNMRVIMDSVIMFLNMLFSRRK